MAMVEVVTMKNNRQAKRRTSLIRGFSQFNPMIAGGQRNKCQKPCGIITQSNYTKCEPEWIFDPKASISFELMDDGKLLLRPRLSGVSKTIYKSGGYVRITKSKLDSLGKTNEQLTVNTTGRTRMSITSLIWTGSFEAYCKSLLTPGTDIGTTTNYVYRSYFVYTHPDTGATTYVYSDPVELIYNDLL